MEENEKKNEELKPTKADAIIGYVIFFALIFGVIMMFRSCINYINEQPMPQEIQPTQQAQVKQKEEIKQQKTEKKELSEQELKELQELEANITKAFYKVDIQKYSNDGNGIYEFYFNPQVWNLLAFDQKENMFKNCARYVQLKTNGTNPNYSLIGTTIKSSANGEVLAKYTVLKGVVVK